MQYLHSLPHQKGPNKYSLNEQTLDGDSKWGVGFIPLEIVMLIFRFRELIPN